MKVSILTAHGYLSLQPDGRFEFRDSVGPWETFDFRSTEPIPIPPNPHPPVVSYNCPKGIDFSDFNEVENDFVRKGLLLAYGIAEQSQVDYYMGKKTELLERGAELEMVPQELYFWERLIGRGCGAEDVAKFGPYAGLVDCNESLVS